MKHPVSPLAQLTGSMNDLKSLGHLSDLRSRRRRLSNRKIIGKIFSDDGCQRIRNNFVLDSVLDGTEPSARTIGGEKLSCLAQGFWGGEVAAELITDT